MSTFTYDHIHIRSRDPEKTAAFYERMFGAEIISSAVEVLAVVAAGLGAVAAGAGDVSREEQGLGEGGGVGEGAGGVLGFVEGWASGTGHGRCS